MSSVDRDRQTLELVLDARGPVRVRFGVDDEGRRRNRLEVHGRAWAEQHGIRVPRIVAHDPDGAWLVSEDAAGGDPTGHEFVDAALDVADRIAAADPLTSAEAPSSWRASRRGTARRAARIWRAGITPYRFVDERRQAQALPPEVPVHGDLYEGNVLYTGHGPATIIDWEHAGRGPRHADAIRLITTVRRSEDAEYGLERLLREAPRSSWPSITVQVRWLSLRHYVDHFAGGSDDPLPAAEVDGARRRWQRAVEWADDIDGARRRPS